MNRNMSKLAIGVVGLCMLGAGMARGAFSFSPLSWGAPGDTAGWYSRNSIATLDAPAGSLQASFPVNSFPVPLTDQIGTSAANMTGDYTAFSGLTVNFDYYTQPGVASALFLASSANSGSTWGYSFSSPASTWASQTISFAPSGNWVELSGSGSFNDALTQVAFVGVQIQSPFTGGTLSYGVDNWQFSNPGVPEPSSIVLMASVVVVGLPLYRRLRKNQTPA